MKFYAAAFFLCSLGVVYSKVSLSRYCSFPYQDDNGDTEINCLIESNSTDSTVTWSLETPDGRTLNLGNCTGMWNSCQSPLSPDVTLFRWSSWSSVTFKNFQQKSGSILVCSESHSGTQMSGSQTSDHCLLGRRKSQVSLNPSCSVPVQTGDGTTISCQIDSNATDSTVTWSVVTPAGRTLHLGQCTGLRGRCQSLLSNITLSRWYSWSTVMFKNFQQRTGSTLVCSESHSGTQTSDQCVLGQRQDVTVCTYGREQCNAKGWTSMASINGGVYCCPAGHGVTINLSNTESPCLCNSIG